MSIRQRLQSFRAYVSRSRGLERNRLGQVVLLVLLLAAFLIVPRYLG